MSSSSGRGRAALVVVAALVAALVALAPPSPVQAESTASASASASAGCPSHGATFEPPDGKTLLVVGQDMFASDAYVEGTGVVPGGFMTYSSVGGPVAGLHLPIKFGSTSWGQHFVDTYPGTVITVGLGITPLEVTASGAYDANLVVLADWVKAAKTPVFLRLGYEFDNAEHANDPALFIAAWRHVVDKLRAEGADNAVFVFHSGSKHPYLNLPLSAWYPGHDYVDWMAVSLFADFQFPYAHKMADLADAYGKPLMISESTPKGYFVPTQPQAWDQWFVPVLDFIETRGVKVWSYINQNWEAEGGWPGWGDSRVQVDPAVEARWLELITGPGSRFLNASPTLLCDQLGYGTPPAPPSVAEPTVTPGASVEGDPVVARAAISPAGSGTSCTVDHGDGSPPVAGSVSGDACTGPQHAYGDDGTYVVTVEVRNSGGGGVASVEHTVANGAPTVAAPTVSTDVRRRAVASASFGDPGADDGPFTCTVDYGDGGGPVAGSVHGETCVGPPHQYVGRSRTYTVTVAVADDDGAVGHASSAHST